LEPSRIDSESEVRCLRLLGSFLERQGAPNVSIQVERKHLAAHPVSGKLLRVIAMKHAGGRRQRLDATSVTVGDS
jgi:hypothetical protein